MVFATIEHPIPGTAEMKKLTSTVKAMDKKSLGNAIPAFPTLSFALSES